MKEDKKINMNQPIGSTKNWNISGQKLNLIPCKEESGLINHAERELKLAGIHEKDADYGGALYNAVMELVRVFSNQGHSGGSAGRVISLFLAT